MVVNPVLKENYSIEEKLNLWITPELVPKYVKRIRPLYVREITGVFYECLKY